MKTDYTQEEINAILDKYKNEDPDRKEMSRPYTMEQINRWMEEGEDEEMMLTHEQVFAGFKRNIHGCHGLEKEWLNLE